MIMTTLVAWLGVDSRGPSSLYFAADSRFTWQPGVVWDFGRKLFASRVGPDMLGYCGDVLFASQSLGQALEMVESRLLAGAEASPAQRFDAIYLFLQRAFERFPVTARHAFTALYATRSNDGMACQFFAGSIAWNIRDGWSSRTLSLPTTSGLIEAYGSGKSSVELENHRWSKSDVGGTSRAVFSAFCDHLSIGGDPGTGGAPQLVGLYRSGAAITFGTVFKNERWLSGARVPESASNPAVEWRDELFQRCDERTLLPLATAQRQPRPRAG